MKISEVIVFVIYLVFMLSIGVYFFFKNRSGGEKTYFLGGRQMGPWVTALSAGASDMSAWVLMGLPTSIYALGLGQLWISVGLAIGYTISWLCEAPLSYRYRKTAVSFFAGSGAAIFLGAVTGAFRILRSGAHLLTSCTRRIPAYMMRLRYFRNHDKSTLQSGTHA